MIKILAGLLLIMSALISGCLVEDEPTETIALDIPYGNDQLQKLDIYSSDTCVNCPVLVYVHGGGWNTGDKSVFSGNLAQFFRTQGYVVVTVNYSLSPNPIDIESPGKVRFPKHVEDVAQSIQWISTNIASYGGNPCEIHLMGHSAGAHIIGQLVLSDVYLSSISVEPNVITHAFLLDGGAYLYYDPVLLEMNSEVKALMQNAYGDKDISEKYFWCDQLLTESNISAKIVLVYSNDEYRRLCNENFYDVTKMLRLDARKVMLPGYSHSSVLEHIYEYWNSQILSIL